MKTETEYSKINYGKKRDWNWETEEFQWSIKTMSSNVITCSIWSPEREVSVVVSMKKKKNE